MSFIYLWLMLLSFCCQCLESLFLQIWRHFFTPPDDLSRYWYESCTGPESDTMENPDKTLTSHFRCVEVIYCSQPLFPFVIFLLYVYNSCRCTVRWLIRAASCPWLCGMIFVWSGSTGWRLALFCICSSTR